MRKSLFLAVFLFMVLCAAYASAETTTVMIYMCGSDLSGAGNSDITEMMNSGVDAEQVRIMLLTGGSAQSDSVYFQPGQVKLSVLQKKSKSPTLKAETIETRDGLNMGDPATLVWFLNACAEYSATDRYALILWDHGGGPMEGVCYDEEYGKDRLTLSELSFALSRSPFSENKLFWIGFDACLMASLETGEVCAPYSRYMIASQETEPASGWNYSFLKGIEQDASGRETGARVQKYYVDPSEDKKLLTLSCVDLDAIDAVNSAVNDFFSALGNALDEDTYSGFSNMRQVSKSFGRAATNSDYDLVDLYHMAVQFAQYAPEESAALRVALDTAIVENGGNVANAFGLSIYSPYRNKKMYSNVWRNAYKAMDYLSVYSNYLDSYAMFWFGKQMADWSRLKYWALPVKEDMIQTVELELTDDQLAHFASAQMIVLRESGGGDTYQKIYEVDDVHLEGSTLRADYDYSALYVLNEYGRPVTDSYPFFMIDEYYYVAVTMESGSLYERIGRYGLDAPSGVYQYENVYLRCRLNEETGELEVLSVIPYSDDPDELITGRQMLELKDGTWPYLYFSNDAVLAFSRDEEGKPLPVSQWPEAEGIDYRRLDRVDREGNAELVSEWLRKYSVNDQDEQQYLLWGEVDNGTDWKLQFLPRQISGMDLYAQYVLTDTQGYQITTELIPLNNPALVSRKNVDIEIFHQDDISVSLTGIDVVDSDITKGIGFRFEARNDTDAAYMFDLLQPCVNLSGISNQLHTSQSIAPHAVTRLYVRLDASALPPLPDGFIHTFGFIPSLENMNVAITNETASSTDRQKLYGKHVTLTEEINLHALGVRTEWPFAGALLGETETAGVRFGVADLKENEDGTLDGVLYIANHSGRDKVLSTRRNGVDSLPPAVVNGYYCANCMEISYALALPDGGETYIPITVHRWSTPVRKAWNQENDFGETDIFDYWGISSVGQIGFIPYLKDTLEAEGEGEVYTVQIPLKQAVPLVKTPENTPMRTRLVDTDGLVMDLRGIIWQDGKLLIEGDYAYHYTSDEISTLYLFGCEVDGTEANARIFLETEGDYQDFPVVTYKSVKERFIVALTGAENGLPADFSTISLQFAFNSSDRDLQYLSPGQIRPLAGAAFSDTLAGAELFSVIPAHMIDTFSPDVLLPEDPSRYAVTLHAPFSREQYQNILDVWAMLVYPRNDGADLYEICALLNYPPIWDGQELRVDFCGLAASVQDGFEPLACSINRTEDGYLYQTMGQLGVTGMKLSGNLRTIYFDSMSFLYRPENETAEFIDYTGEGVIHEEEGDPVVASFCPPVRIPTLPDGTFGFIQLISSEKDAYLRQETFKGVQPTIELRPAEEFPLLAVFFIRDTAGQGYSLVIPYEEAILR